MVPKWSYYVAPIANHVSLRCLLQQLLLTNTK